MPVWHYLKYMRQKTKPEDEQEREEAARAEKREEERVSKGEEAFILKDKESANSRDHVELYGAISKLYRRAQEKIRELKESAKNNREALIRELQTKLGVDRDAARRIYNAVVYLFGADVIQELFEKNADRVSIRDDAIPFLKTLYQFYGEKIENFYHRVLPKDFYMWLYKNGLLADPELKTALRSALQTAKRKGVYGSDIFSFLIPAFTIPTEEILKNPKILEDIAKFVESAAGLRTGFEAAKPVEIEATLLSELLGKPVKIILDPKRPEDAAEVVKALRSLAQDPSSNHKKILEDPELAREVAKFIRTLAKKIREVQERERGVPAGVAVEALQLPPPEAEFVGVRAPRPKEIPVPEIKNVGELKELLRDYKDKLEKRGYAVSAHIVDTMLKELEKVPDEVTAIPPEIMRDLQAQALTAARVYGALKKESWYWKLMNVAKKVVLGDRSATNILRERIRNLFPVPEEIHPEAPDKVQEALEKIAEIVSRPEIISTLAEKKNAYDYVKAMGKNEQMYWGIARDLEELKKMELTPAKEAAKVAGKLAPEVWRRVVEKR